MVRLRMVWSSIAKHSSPLRVLRLLKGHPRYFYGLTEICLNAVGALL